MADYVNLPARFVNFDFVSAPKCPVQHCVLAQCMRSVYEQNLVVFACPLSLHAFMHGIYLSSTLFLYASGFVFLALWYSHWHRRRWQTG